MKSYAKKQSPRMKKPKKFAATDLRKKAGSTYADIIQKAADKKKKGKL